MWSKIQCCLTFALLLMVVLADHHLGHDHGEHSADHHHHLHHGKDEPHPSHDGTECSYRRLSPFNADFAFKLYNKLSTQADAKGKNIFFSPLSISLALSMLAVGAKAETHSQIFNTLGYSSLTEDEVNDAYEHILHALDHSQEAVAGGGLAIREGFKPLDKFLTDLQHFYHGEAFSVDFSHPDVAVEVVNKFIAKKTNNTITDMLKTLDRDTILVLINYIYFRGEWEKPFDLENTHKADFYLDDDNKVTVDMMKRTGRFNSYRDSENFTTVIKLPYKHNTSLLIVLPDQGKLEEVEKHLSRDVIKKWFSKLSLSSLDLYLPKFSISASTCLGDTLKDLGIVDAFSDDADFSGISAETKLKVSKVLHKAVVKVDEKGTEAAAATTIEIMPMSLPDTLRINRPFLVFILEKTTKSFLFIGKVTNPTEQ